MKIYKRTLKPISRKLRNDMTECEQRLWQHIRRKQIAGIQFYRQKPLAQFIVDFYAPAVNLVIEIDGSQHLIPENQAKDKEREIYLNSLGLFIIRFSNIEIMENITGVIEHIYQYIISNQTNNA